MIPSESTLCQILAVMEKSGVQPKLHALPTRDELEVESPMDPYPEIVQFSKCRFTTRYLRFGPLGTVTVMYSPV